MYKSVCNTAIRFLVNLNLSVAESNLNISVSKNDILSDLQLCNKYSNIHFFSKYPFRLVKLPLGLAAHPPTQ